MVNNNIINNMINVANKSSIDKCHSAVLLLGNKMVGIPKNNQERSICHGYICSSLHAEANAISCYFGKNLKFDKTKSRWYLLRHKSKKCKKD